MTGASPACRCGWDGVGPHPCHARLYACGAPARLRLYGARPANVAGVQPKLQASETWACDACWANFSEGHFADTAVHRVDLGSGHRESKLAALAAGELREGIDYVEKIEDSQ